MCKNCVHVYTHDLILWTQRGVYLYSKIAVYFNTKAWSAQKRSDKSCLTNKLMGSKQPIQKEK
jgi:hypothetical protein